MQKLLFYSWLNIKFYNRYLIKVYKNTPEILRIASIHCNFGVANKFKHYLSTS